MNHIKIEIVANEYQQEELIALLDDYHPTGFEQTNEALFAFFNEDGFGKEPILKILEGYSTFITIVEAQNWNEEWERGFAPVVVDDFVAVRAHFHQPITQVEHEIVITPKMSFGTGHHATTYMMMQQMRYLNFKDKAVFDFGTGTGVLTILAEKLGAASVTAIDVDDWSIENARENFERNSCERIVVTLSSKVPSQPFGIVLANINKNVILDYLPQLTLSLATRAYILFSGLLVADEADVTTAAKKNGLSFEQKTERQGWISLLFTKQK